MTSQSKHTILLVDDEPDILDFLKYNLEKEGFNIKTANSGKEGIEIAKSVIPDLILLDVMMPEMDGMDTCGEMRNIPTLKNTIIAFLSARSEDYSQIAGLNVGADDYITKPIKPKLLISKINSLLRRSNSIATVSVKNRLVLNRDAYLVVLDNKEIKLPKKEFELLALLMSKPGKVFLREEILSKIWGNEIIVGDRTIDVHIRKLREKLFDSLIDTVKGIGYKINQTELEI